MCSPRTSRLSTENWTINVWDVLTQCEVRASLTVLAIIPTRTSASLTARRSLRPPKSSLLSETRAKCRIFGQHNIFVGQPNIGLKLNDFTSDRVQRKRVNFDLLGLDRNILKFDEYGLLNALDCIVSLQKIGRWQKKVDLIL